MTKDHNNVLEAKRSLKVHIEFMEALVKHLNGPDKVLRARAMWAAWCLHRYFNDNLISDIQDAIEKNSLQPEGNQPH